MKNFVVACLDHIGGEFKMQKIQALSVTDALRIYMTLNIKLDDYYLQELKELSYEEIKEDARDADLTIDALEI